MNRKKFISTGSLLRVVAMAGLFLIGGCGEEENGSGQKTRTYPPNCISFRAATPVR